MDYNERNNELSSATNGGVSVSVVIIIFVIIFVIVFVIISYTKNIVISGAKTEMSEEKVRTGKISKGQKQKLLEILRGHRNVAMGQFGGPNSGKSAQAVWETVAAELNACGAACKTGDQWKKCWADWKSSVKKQQAAINRFNQATGNRPATEGPPPLEGTDKEVLEFFPAALVSGDGGTIEAGFQEVFLDDELQESLDTLLATPVKEVAASTSKASSTSKAASTSSSFSSAFEEVKELMNKQEEKRCSEMGELMNVLKTMSSRVEKKVVKDRT